MRRNKGSKGSKARQELIERDLNYQWASDQQPSDRQAKRPRLEQALVDPCDELVAQYVNQQVKDAVILVRKGQLKPKDALRSVTLHLARELSSDQFLTLLERFHSYSESPPQVLLVNALQTALAQRQQELKQQQQSCHRQSDIRAPQFDQQQHLPACQYASRPRYHWQ
jgi:hypothetical protein